MRIKIINGVSGETFHETENILEAGACISWLLPHPDFINEEKVTIRVDRQ